MEDFKYGGKQIFPCTTTLSCVGKPAINWYGLKASSSSSSSSLLPLLSVLSVLPLLVGVVFWLFSTSLLSSSSFLSNGENKTFVVGPVVGIIVASDDFRDLSDGESIL